MKTFKKILSIISAIMIIMTVPISVQASPLPENKWLQFNEDGKFKILIFADLQDTDQPQEGTIDMITYSIEKLKPDLVVLTGDNTSGNFKNADLETTEKAVDEIIKPINDAGIPFAFVFGNHDHEGLSNEKNAYTEREAKEAILKMYNKYDTCMAVAGEEITGYCNYNLLIKDSKGENDVFNLWMIDSNTYATEEEGGGYGYVAEDQTQWYINKSNELKETNNGNAIPSILFQHIIVPEIFDMLTECKKSEKGSIRGNDGKYYIKNPDYFTDGELREWPCPPNTNHGQFDSWIEQGDVLGAFFGHDHVNDFNGTYKDIRIVNVPGAGFSSYGNNRGVRTIELDENDLTAFTTELHTYDEIVGKKISNVYIRNFGYEAYNNSIRPGLIIGIPCGAVAIVAVAVITTVVVKKNKKKKAAASV